MKSDGNKKYIRISLSGWSEAFLVFLGFIMSRPMILGNNYSMVGLAILVLIVMVELYRSGLKINIEKNGKIYFSMVLFFLYCALNCLLFQSDRMQEGLQTVVYLVGCCAAFYFLGKNQILKVAFIRIIYGMLSLFAISYVISVLLMMYRGWDSIYLFEIDYGYFIKATVYSPFTITYGNLSLNGVVFKRLLGFARECGIMQLFYIWGFYMCDKYFKKTIFLRVLMCIGIIACLSTTGFIVFTISLIFYMDIKKIFSWKTVAAIGLIAIGIYMTFFANGTSISTRATATITDRLSGFIAGYEAFKDSPFFGKGFYDTLGYSNEVQVGVSAISSLGQIGIFGILFWLYSYFVAFKLSKNKRRYLHSVTPIIITGMFAQPLLAAPATYLFLFMDYDDDKIFILK